MTNLRGVLWAHCDAWALEKYLSWRQNGAQQKIRCIEPGAPTVISMLDRETEAVPISAAISALGHIGDPAAVPSIVKHALHASYDVRFSVAFALGCFANEPTAIPTLLLMMDDLDPRVRDWAT